MALKILFVVFVALNYVNSAKILGVFPLPATSHYILASKLMKGLAEAGNDVTMISPYEIKGLPKNVKYTDIVLDGFYEDFQETLKKFNLFEMNMNSPLTKMQQLLSGFTENVNKTLYHPKVKKLIQSNPKFDAVIMEQFNNDALKVFSHIFNCPLIILSTSGPNDWVNPTVGNPQPVSYVPNMFFKDFSEDLSLVNRAKNALFSMLSYVMTRCFALPKQEEIMHQAYPGTPPLYDLYTNVSLVLLNSHSSTFKALPMVPNMVEIGGYFIDPPQKLPQDLQDFLDNAKDGAVYFSMGSNLKSKDIPATKRKAILNVLGKLKEKVLWKFEEDLPEKPSNVMIKKWLPQQDILAHPNVKLFITHGGLLSTTETIYHGVPILAVPVFADQPANAQKAVFGGYGLKLDYNDPNFSEETFGSLIHEILNNPKYKENVQRRSKIFHDRPQTPMKTAVYWVEYIIRHKGAPHLRVAGVRMPWYQYFMIDVIGALILSIFIALYSVKLVFKKLCRQNNKSNKTTKKIKTN